MLPATSHAAYPGANGKIAFTNDCNILTTTTEATAPEVLIDLTDCINGPVWSPAGKRLVFSRGGGGTFSSDLWLAHADGRGRRQLTSMPGGEATGSWSPSGRKIVFTSYTKKAFGEIYVVGADGTGLRRLTDDAFTDSSPIWSPTVHRIAFVSARGGSQDIWTMNPSGGELVQLTEEVTRCPSCPDALGGINGLSWSPDGTRIAFASNKGNGLSLLYVMNANGTELTEVEGVKFEATYPAWSPDGTQIVYSTGETLATIPADGGEERSLPGTAESSRADWQPLP